RPHGPDAGLRPREPASRHETAARETAPMTELPDRYLWEGSGEPDPEIVRLEALLRPYRHKDLPLLLPARAPLVRSTSRRFAPAAMQVLTAAASLALVV